MLTSLIESKDLELSERVGEGAYGKVWRGTWKDKVVAVKKIKSKNIPNSQRAKILDEVYILTKLRHPNIVNFYGHSLVPRELWIVTELVDGGTLYEQLHSKAEPISWIFRLKWARQAAMSVNFLHSCDPVILHRDIKSLNFLLSKDLSTLKLIDFGLSKFSNIISKNPRGPGTIRWAAPETIFVAKIQWTEKADIYSLGMTFYEIASRTVPFEELDDERVRIAVHDGHRPELHAGPDCPKEFIDIIRDCWNNDPTKRPSAQQLVERLETLIIEEESTLRLNSSQTFGVSLPAPTGFLLSEPFDDSELPLSAPASLSPISNASPSKESLLFSRGACETDELVVAKQLQLSDKIHKLELEVATTGNEKKLTRLGSSTFEKRGRRLSKTPSFKLCHLWRETLYGSPDIKPTELQSIVGKQCHKDHPPLGLTVGLAVDGIVSFKATDSWHMSTSPLHFSCHDHKLFKAGGLQLLRTEGGEVGLCFDAASSRHFFICYKQVPQFSLQLKLDSKSNAFHNEQKQIVFVTDPQGIRLVYTSPIIRTASKTITAALQWDPKKKRIELPLHDHDFPVIIAFGICTRLPEDTFVPPFPAVRIGALGNLEHPECSSESEEEQPQDVVRGTKITKSIAAIVASIKKRTSPRNDLAHFGFILPTLGKALSQRLWYKQPFVNPVPKGQGASLPRDSIRVALHPNGSVDFRNSIHNWTLNVSLPDEFLGLDADVYTGEENALLLKSASFEEGVVVKGVLKQFFVLPARKTFTLKLQGGKLEFDTRRLTLLDDAGQKALTYHKPFITDANRKLTVDVTWGFNNGGLIINLPSDVVWPVALVFAISCSGESSRIGKEREEFSSSDEDALLKDKPKRRSGVHPIVH